MFKVARRMLCRHAFTWIERRQDDVCVHCGQSRAGQRRMRGGLLSIGFGLVLFVGAFGVGLSEPGAHVLQPMLQAGLGLFGDR